MRNKFNGAAPYTEIDKLKDGEIVHLRTGVNVSEEQLIEALSGARVIYLGEQHDNIAAHEMQRDIIQALHEKFPGKIAVGMEMFRRDVQDTLDGVEKGTLSKDDFNQLFDEQWTALWRPAYQMVLDYMHEKGIPVVGLKPSKDLEDVVRRGDSRADVPELDLDDAYHKACYLPFFQQSNMPPEAAEKRYRMMVLWDEAMAETVADFLQNPDNADKKLIVIAGNGHVQYGFGIPKRAYRRVPHDYSIVAPHTKEEPAPEASLLYSDYAWRLPYDQLKVKAKPDSRAKPPSKGA